MGYLVAELTVKVCKMQSVENDAEGGVKKDFDCWAIERELCVGYALHEDMKKGGHAIEEIDLSIC